MTILEIKTAIENGSKFNGTVYGKDNGKNWTTLFIYLDGKFTKIAEVVKKDADAKKVEFTAELSSKSNSSKNIDQTKVFGTFDWLFSGMNAE